MDLGLTGRRALVCASSKGLGYACALALAREGVDVTINGRSGEALLAAKAQIEKASGRTVTTIVADLGDKAARGTLIAACGDLDILVNNNGGSRTGTKRPGSPPSI